MKIPIRRAFAIILCCCCGLAPLHGALATNDVTTDSLDAYATDSVYLRYHLIEHGRLQDAAGFLYSPLCVNGEVLAPALIADLAAFFSGYPITRVIDRGSGHYLLTRNVANDGHDSHRNSFPGALNMPYAMPYAELHISSVSDWTFTLHIADAYFNGEGLGISTCFA